MQQPKRELGEALARLMGAGTSSLVINPAIHKAAISSDIDHDGQPVAGTEPRLLRTRGNKPEEPAPTPKPPEPPPEPPEPPPAAQEPTFDERLHELRRDINQSKLDLAILAAVDRFGRQPEPPRPLTAVERRIKEYLAK